MKEGDDEPFGNVREGIARHMGHDYQVKIGFAIRKAAGKDRVRVLVLIDRYPTVEFVGADAEIGGESRVASIIKDCKKKHVPAGSEVPPEYVGFQVGPYRDVVNGPGAAYGIAVICAQNDYETMVRHALIRYTYPQS